MSKRDEFSAPVKRVLAERSGFHCSNPSCRSLTSGPEISHSGSVNLGVAAHITAAAKGGSRYDPSLTSEERASIENGIWLCTHCSVLIDKKENDYSVALLKEWKEHSESAARKGLEKPGTFASGESNAYTVAFICRYKKPSNYFSFSQLPTPKGFSWSEKVIFKPLNKNAKDISQPSVPIILDAKFGPMKKAFIFQLVIQNLGTGIEKFASIKISMENASIWKQKNSQTERITCFSNLKKAFKSSVGGFSVTNLMPGEIVTANVHSVSPGPFNVEMYTESESSPLCQDRCRLN